MLTSKAHAGSVRRDLGIPRRQVGVRVVSRFVIVVFHIQTGELGEINPQRATTIVYVLAVQRLERKGERSRSLVCCHPLGAPHCCIYHGNQC